MKGDKVEGVFWDPRCKTIGYQMRAGPNSVLEMVPLVNDKSLIHPKPVIKMKVTVGSYRAPVQEVVDF